jgi:amino acid transporter
MGALTQTELVGMFPKAGGQYVFLREGLGPLWGFPQGFQTTNRIMDENGNELFDNTNTASVKVQSLKRVRPVGIPGVGPRGVPDAVH